MQRKELENYFKKEFYKLAYNPYDPPQYKWIERHVNQMLLDDGETGVIEITLPPKVGDVLVLQVHNPFTRLTLNLGMYIIKE